MLHQNCDRDSNQSYSPMLQFTSRFLKYFLLAMFGVAIAYVLSMIFGILPIAFRLIPFIWDVFWRVGILLLCLMAIVAFLESLR
ncbi:MAG: hypothetical protein SAK29_13780 [Scytonema sp. PMC 1069.18]|nr:hypothetical protein [Scytonema sp. PMC 1069.18]MEC4882064.1 hypothetical protein [Scytonema sp. PMC 1070.18]